MPSWTTGTPSAVASPARTGVLQFDVVSYLSAEQWAAWPGWRREAGGEKSRVSTTEPSFLWTASWDAEQQSPTRTQTTSSVRMLFGRRAASDTARNYPTTTPRHWPAGKQQTWGRINESRSLEVQIWAWYNMHKANKLSNMKNKTVNYRQCPGVCTQATIFWPDIPTDFKD